MTPPLPPLIDSVVKNNFPRLSSLLSSENECPVDINQLCQKFGWSALHHAAIYGRDSMASLLIERGAEINLRNRV